MRNGAPAARFFFFLQSRVGAQDIATAQAAHDPARFVALDDRQGVFSRIEHGHIAIGLFF